MFLADSALTEIITNVAGLKLELQTTMAVLGAVLAPLLRTTEPLQASLEPPSKPSRRSRVRPRLRALRASRQHRRRRASRPSEALARARAALEANPDATLAHVAKLAKCSPSTAVNARKDLAKEARKQARKTARETPKPAPTDLRQRAQQFLKDTLAHGAKPATTVEEAAAKAHVDPRALEWARGALGIVASRSNTGVQAVTWSLPAP